MFSQKIDRMTSKRKLQEETADNPPEENADIPREENTDNPAPKSLAPSGEKRGRGRPPLPPEAKRVYISTGRPRGRPRVKPPFVPSGRPRGRPRVKPLPDPNAPKRPRGRPRVWRPRGRPRVYAPMPDPNAPKRPRGRPRVYGPMEIDTDDSPEENADNPPEGNADNMLGENAENSIQHEEVKPPVKMTVDVEHPQQLQSERKKQVYISTGRPRGRPRVKPLPDPNTPKRPRGRPRVKAPKEENADNLIEENAYKLTQHGEAKPPVKMTVDVGHPQQLQSEKIKQVYISTGRPRGRPRVKPLPDPNAPKRPRGRPCVKAPKPGSLTPDGMKRARGRPPLSPDAKKRNGKMFKVKITSRGDKRRSRGQPPRKVQEENTAESIN